jgi:hypothetical protein
MEVYIWFPTDNIADMNSEQINNFVREINIIVKRIWFEKGTRLLYENNNLEDLMLCLETKGEEEHIGTIDFETLILSTLYTADAQFVRDNKNECIYKLWDFYSQKITNDFPNILKYYVSKLISNSGNKCLFLNFRNAFDYNRSIIPIFKDCSNDNTLPKFVHIVQTNKFTETDQWLIDNGLTRNYNHSDTRHIENHPNYRRGKSPIIGGEGGKTNLENLLPSALCDNFKKDLIAYDEATSRYVWYEYENDNPQNQYHGYHLVKPNTHVQDLEAEKKIPIEVLEIIKYRKEINFQ